MQELEPFQSAAVDSHLGLQSVSEAIVHNFLAGRNGLVEPDTALGGDHLDCENHHVESPAGRKSSEKR